MTFDVAARLDQGRPSVSHTQTYVAACHTLGYQHPDLTANGAQVLDWYGAEDGMDLAVLDADCARLRSAANAAEDALALERDAAAALAAAWNGESASAADSFVDRHCAAATATAAVLRNAADSCAALRDSLWRLLGDKVHAAVAIDDRRAEVRTAWLAAAQTVMSGAADRTEATDVVTHQITPYIDADVRTDWLGAMRAATTSIAAAYDDALKRLNAYPPTQFDVPAQLTPPMPDPPHATTPVAPAPAPAAVTVPAAAPAEPPAPSTAPSTAPAAPAPPRVGADAPVPQPVPTMPPAQTPAVGGAVPGSLPGVPAAPGLGGGLSGLAGQIAQALDGLFTGQPDASADLPAPDPVDPGLDEPQPEDDPPVEDPKDAEAETDSPVQAADGSVDTEETDTVPTPEEPPAEDAPPPPAAEPPPPVPEPPAPEPAAPESTPCEIAADELPQVGQ
jgi:uncharacterized protein YukE